MARKTEIIGDAGLLADAEKYYAAHPYGAAAMRHPRIAIHRRRYVAYMGASITGGVFGFGTSIHSALRAFDDLYPRNRMDAKTLT